MAAAARRRIKQLVRVLERQPGYLAGVIDGVQLIEPRLDMAEAYGAFLQEFIDAGEAGAIFTVPDQLGDPVESIRRLLDYARGENLPEGWVPSSCFWLVSGQGTLLGEIHIRHRLTPGLEQYGGHIGYMVRPGERKKGYATEMLRLGLEKARGIGLRRVKITCDIGNHASSRVVEKNGGSIESRAAGSRRHEVLHYRIDL